MINACSCCNASFWCFCISNSIFFTFLGSGFTPFGDMMWPTKVSSVVPKTHLVLFSLRPLSLMRESTFWAEVSWASFVSAQIMISSWEFATPLMPLLILISLPGRFNWPSGFHMAFGVSRSELAYRLVFANIPYYHQAVSTIHLWKRFFSSWETIMMPFNCIIQWSQVKAYP